MLKIELLSQAGHTGMKHVIAVAYGEKCSRVICADHGPIHSILGSGKVYVLHKTHGGDKIITTFFHSEAILTVRDNLVSVFAGRIVEAQEDMMNKVQEKLLDDLWLQFIRNRERAFEQYDWVKDNPETLKTID